MNEFLLGVVVLVIAAWAILWLSPSMLGALAARMLARREAIRTQRMALSWFLKRFEEDE
jgi:hypothetical protein